MHYVEIAIGVVVLLAFAWLAATGGSHRPKPGEGSDDAQD